MANRELTDRIIGCYWTVRRRLPHSLDEALYQRAMRIELANQGMRAVREVHYLVYYDDEVVGDYRADIVVDDAVIVEIKKTHRLVEAHVEQLQRYLNVSGVPVGLLLTFGPVPDIRRVERDR